MTSEHCLNDGFDNTMCILCIHVFDRQRSVLYAARDSYIADGDLEPVVYTCGEEDHHTSKDGRIVGFGHLLKHDPTILAPRSIAPGQIFSRRSVDTPWEEEI